MPIVDQIHKAVNSENPSQPYIRFLPGIEDLESYAESGMLAQVLKSSVSGDYDDKGNAVYRFTVSFAPFDTFNKGKEKANYYDKNGVPCLTAREAGCYNEIDEHIYLMDDDKSVEVVLPEKEDLPFENIEVDTVLEVVRANGHPKVKDTIDLRDLAMEYFVKGDTVSKVAVFLRLWIRSQNVKG